MVGLEILYAAGLADISALTNNASLIDSFSIMIIYQIVLLIANLIAEFKSIQKYAGIFMMLLYVGVIIEILIIINFFN